MNGKSVLPTIIVSLFNEGEYYDFMSKKGRH